MPCYKLPDLSYDFSALEPVISVEIMQLHYAKHHQAYVNNLNAALDKEQQTQSKGDLSALLAVQSALSFNGGGHLNHSLFWANLAPQNKGGGGAPKGELARLIALEFGSFEGFIEKMSCLSVAIQGSGWGWLGWDPGVKRLILTATLNHDTLSSLGLVPLLVIDVWEHAYYLQYKNLRADYVKNIWNIVNWPCVEERFVRFQG